MDNEDLVALLRALPPEMNVDIREGSAWMRCPNPEHAQTGATPPFKVTTEIGPYMGSSHCFACGIGGNLKKTIALLGLSSDLKTLHIDEPYAIFSESEEAQLRGNAKVEKLTTEEWPEDAEWRGINAGLVRAVGGRMLIAGDGREPLLILPVVMRGVQKGCVKCRCIAKHDGFDYVNHPKGRWSKDSLFPYDYVRTALDDAGGLRVAAVVEGSRDSLTTIQNGLPALATLGSQSWSDKCASAIRSLSLDMLVIMADPDTAGDLLANRVYDDLHDHMVVKVVRLPSKTVQTKRGDVKVKLVDPADLSRKQLATVLSKMGVDIGKTPKELNNARSTNQLPALRQAHPRA